MSNASIVSITDLEGIILYANENFARISGYSIEELTGKGHNIINSRYHPKSFWSDMWKTISAGKNWRGDIKNRTKSGGYYWVDSQIMPVKDTGGKIVAYLSVRNDITSEKNYESDLEKEKNKINAIYNSTTDSHILIDPTKQVLSFNRSAARLIKQLYGLDLTKKTSIFNYLPKESVPEFIETFSKALKGAEVKTEQELTFLDGKKKWFRISYLPVYDDSGNLIGVSKNSSNIDLRKRSEEKRLVEKERLTALIESIPDAIFFKDGESRWLITNETAKKLFKLHEIDWVGKSELELADLHPDFRLAHETCLVDDEKAWTAKQLTLFTEFVLDDFGRTREYEVRKMPVFNPDGSRKALVIIGTDITERRLHEDELKRTKKGLEQTMRLAKIGGWEVDLTDRTITWSGLTREMAEVPLNYIPTYETVLNFYKEGESRTKMQQALAKAIKEGIGFEIEVQMVSTRGKEYWARTLAEPKMVDGKCVKIFGYFQDITEKVELSKKNREIERKFSRLIEKSTDAIVLQDALGNVIYFSPAAEHILGYAAEEVIGKNSITVYHPDDITQVLNRREIIINSQGKSFPIATNRMRHKDGHYVYVEGTVTNLLHDESIGAMVSNFRDVTEKRLTEDRLKAKNERLEEIAWLFSHEVRGPVATILGLANLFNSADKLDPINEEVLTKILLPVHRLDQIISQIVQQTNELEDETAEFPKAAVTHTSGK